MEEAVGNMVEDPAGRPESGGYIRHHGGSIAGVRGAAVPAAAQRFEGIETR